MKELQFISSKQVVIESKAKKLTNGELALLALMNKCINDKSVLSVNSVKDIYQSHVMQSNKIWDQFKNWDSSMSISEGGGYRDYLPLEIDQKAIQWFKSALGNLIIKAKLIAIPVIDLD